MAAEAMIEARGLRKRFGQTVALDGLDLEAQVGTVLRFVGQCPYGWLHANGQYIVRELYPDLYSVLQSFASPEQQSGAPQRGSWRGSPGSSIRPGSAHVPPMPRRAPPRPRGCR